MMASQAEGVFVFCLSGLSRNLANISNSDVTMLALCRGASMPFFDGS